MIFRIMASNKERSEAYAELLDRIELLADGRVFCVPWMVVVHLRIETALCIMRL